MADTEAEDREQDLVTVAKFRTPAEAEMARERLELEGILGFCSNAMAVGVMPVLGGDLGGIELKVAKSNVERAKEILGEVAE